MLPRKEDTLMTFVRRPFLILSGLLIALLLSSCGGSAQTSQPTQSSTPKDHFNAPCNILISDQFNNRVVEVAPMGISCGPLAQATRPCAILAPGRSLASMTLNA